MPYIEALVLESLRLFMSFACALPHRATKDTKLNGYDIPKVDNFRPECSNFILFLIILGHNGCLLFP